jgi:hypothetical protein
MTPKQSKYIFIIGIDPGVETGVCVWLPDSKQITYLNSMKIHEAMKLVWKHRYVPCNQIMVRVEDARKRKWFGKSGREQLQGAGSIKRDAKIWEDYLTDMGVDFEMVAPKNNKTKLTAALFKNVTGYGHRTNEHSRDAAMLVYGM